MKLFLVLFAALGLSVMPGQSQPAPSHFSPSALRVVVLPKPAQLKSIDWELWSLIPKEMPIPHFDDCMTDGWIGRFEIARRALVAKAKELKLEADALDKIFDIIIKKDNLALLPLIALRAKLNGKQVWVVYFNWEDRPPAPKVVKTKDGPKLSSEPAYGLIHDRAYAYTVDTFEEVAFITCN